MNIPRPEYPRPQFVRPDWLCLNGEWQFEIDAGDSGLERGLLNRDLNGMIQVPFCPESTLSGVGHTDFMNAVWYRRQVLLPSEWTGKRVLLHFQACDYDTTVWVNGVEVGRHRGGFTPFTCDLEGAAAPGEQAVIVVRAQDRARTPQPRGKQSDRYASHGCLYTRTTGIWQTVWLEPVPRAAALKRPRITPDVAGSLFRIEQPIAGSVLNQSGLRLHVALHDEQGTVAEATVRADLDFAPRLDLPVPAQRRRLWSPADPHLYRLSLTLRDANDQVIDAAESYAGLRSVAIEGKSIKINGESVFQRLVLDQGYWPDGVMTAPSDAELVADIRRALDAGFNGARLHQKVFEERFLYHADRLGYLLWGEFADWGCGGYGPEHNHQQPGATFITQFLEVLERDYSHPSIIGWCPLNETWQPLSDQITPLDDVTRGMFLACKAMDTTRPVLDASGYSHRVRETDVYDSHDYDQNPATFAERHQGIRKGTPFINRHNNRPESLPYRGQPYFVSEFGGIWWNPAAFDNKESWGYGERVKNLDEFYERFTALCSILLAEPDMFGYCYTQLTDIYPEENGIYTFDRRPKFDLEKLRSVQKKRAAIEPENR